MKKGSSTIVFVPLLGVLALGAACAPSSTGTGQQAATQTPMVAETKRESVSAEVVAIDQQNRILTLQRPDGTKREVQVDERVKRFDEINVGDTITAEYYESAAVSLRKQAPGEPSVTAAAPTVEVAPAGERPAGVVADTVVITARVEDIDVGNREVTLTGPEGNTLTMRVDESVKNLDQVKKGDQVVVTYTQAIAVGVSSGGGEGTLR